MLTQAFTVIAGDDDDGIIVNSSFFQKRNPVRDCGIGVGNFSVVQMIFVLFGERRGGLVGIMRIVQMHPNKVWSGSVLIEPGFGVRDDLHPAALDASPAFFGIGLDGKVIVEIEAAIEAGSKRVAVENHGSNEG